MDRLYGDINMILAVWNFSVWVIRFELSVGLGKSVRVRQQAIKWFFFVFWPILSQDKELVDLHWLYAWNELKDKLLSFISGIFKKLCDWGMSRGRVIT